MKIIGPLLVLLLLCGCHPPAAKDQSGTIVSMQVIDRNGFNETISNKDRLSPYQSVDFLTPQPYKKVLRVYGRNVNGQSTSKITSYHENGLIWQYLSVVDGRAHGLYREWYPNGQQKIEAHLIEGAADINDLAQATWVFEGVCKVWNDQGALLAEFFYEKGLLDTPSRYHHANGALQKIIPYVQGEIDGVVEAYDESGNTLEQIPYVKGEKHGLATAYWEPLKLLSREDYVQGRLIAASYYDNSGRLVAEIKEGRGKQAYFEERVLKALFSYENGVQEGEVELFEKNGTLHCSFMLKEGKKHGQEWEYYSAKEGEPLRAKLCLNWNEDKIEGQVRTWYPEGQLESQREVNGNKKQGVAFAWYKNGDLMLNEEYENDLLIKGAYFKKGEKKAVSKVDSGKGIASLYAGDGVFLKKVTYEKGRPQLDDHPLP